MSKGFKGKYSHAVDAKGRIIMPADFRESLGEKFVITSGLDPCLYVYPSEEWENIENKCREISFTSKDARKFARFFIGGARDCEIDKQGRVLIPPVQRESVGIDREVVLFGVLNRIEIWSKERWQESGYENMGEEDRDEIAEHMNELGFGI